MVYGDIKSQLITSGQKYALTSNIREAAILYKEIKDIKDKAFKKHFISIQDKIYILKEYCQALSILIEAIHNAYPDADIKNGFTITYDQVVMPDTIKILDTDNIDIDL